MLNYKQLYDRKDLTLWMDISTYCNAACPQCHRTNPTNIEKTAHFLELEQWSADQFKKAFSPETMAAVWKFDFCGTWGDPLMNKDIVKILQYIKEESKCIVAINTNGAMRNEEWFFNLCVMLGSRLEITFTVDGINQEMHELYRQKTDLSKILEHIETVASTHSAARVHTIIFKHNEKHLWELANMVKKAGAEHILFTPSNRFHSGDKKAFTFIKNNKQYLLEKTRLSESTLDALTESGFNLITDYERLKGVLHDQV